MKNNEKTNQRQIDEWEHVRQSIAEPKRSNFEIKRVEQALWKSEENLRNIMQNINDVVFQLSSEGIIEYVSPRVKELHGYNPEELIGKHLKKTTPKSDVPKALKLLKSALSGKTVKNIEIDQVDSNGKIVHMEINSTPVKKDGKVIAVQGVMRDITDRKRAEEMLQKARQELERRVEERTAELSKTNVFLKQEITERKRVEKELKNSEERFRALTENAPIGIYYNELNGTFLYGNKKAEEIVGYKREELIGKSFLKLKLINSKDIVRAGKLLLLNRKGKPTGPDEFVITRKDGTKKLVEINTSVITLSGKKVVIGMVQDISERKQMEEELRESEEELEAIFNYARVGIARFDKTGKILRVNKRILEIGGYTEQEIVGKRLNLLKMFPPKSMAAILANFTKLIAGKKVPPFDVEVHTKKGEKLTTELHGSFLRKKGKVAGMVGIMRDITDRKQMEQDLRQSEERFRKVVETMEVGLGAIDENGVLTYVNEYLAKMLGYSADEMIGRSTLDFYYDEEGRKAQEEIFTKRKAGMGDSTPYEVTWKKKDGQKVYAILSPTPNFDADGRYTGSFAIHTDITKRKLMEQELRDSEERYRVLYEDNPSMYFTVDAEGTVLSVNHFGAEELGYSVQELVGQPVLNVFYEEDKKAVQQQLKTCIQNPTEMFHWEFRKVRKDGNMIWVKEAARAVRSRDGNLVVLIVCEDITERKRADEKLKANFDTLSKSLESTVSALASAFEVRDPYTAGHQQRVTDLACAIAEDMGLGVEQIAGIRMAGLIHDIGKINIPAEILNKPGHLTEIEYSLFKNHPQVGHDVLKTIEFPWPVAQIVLQHHERFDGSGYPQGLAGKEILLEARILAVADIVEAIASHRPYRPARGIGDALEEILHNKGTLYDPEVVDACLRVFYERGFKFEQTLKVVAAPKIH